MQPVAGPVEQLVAAGVVIFMAGVARSSLGRYRPAANAARNAGSRLLGPRVRSWYVDQLAPFEEFCVRRGITAAALSYAQLAGGLLVGALYAAGCLFTAGWVLLATSSLDIVDGRVARRTGDASAHGAFLDSVIDRYVESFAYVGLAAYFRSSVALWFVLLALIGSLMVSYTRARAEGLGAEGQAGVLQRPERLVLLGFGTIFGGLYAHLVAPWVPGPADLLSAATLLVIAVLANVTAVQRALTTARELAGVWPAAAPGGAADVVPRRPPEPAAPDDGVHAATARRVIGTFVLMLGAGAVLDLHAPWAGLAAMLAGAACLGSGLGSGRPLWLPGAADAQPGLRSGR